jgi:ATP-dependent Clp protease ATP-binding subunit ClpC
MSNNKQVLASRLTNDDSASSMDGTGEFTLESRLPPALNDDEYVVFP